MNLKLNWLAVSLFVFTANLAFAASSYETRTGSDNFSRIIELRNQRMQGDDITSLQNRLLSLGFAGLGEDDGYVHGETERWVYFALEDNTRIINGTADYNTAFVPDISLMLQIMEREFARTRR